MNRIVEQGQSEDRMTEEEVQRLLNTPLPALPEEHRGYRIIAGDILRLGTYEQAFGAEAADAHFSEPSCFDEARKSAARKLPRIIFF